MNGCEEWFAIFRHDVDAISCYYNVKYFDWIVAVVVVVIVNITYYHLGFDYVWMYGCC